MNGDSAPEVGLWEKYRVMTQNAATGMRRREFAGGLALWSLALGIPAAAVQFSNPEDLEATSDLQRQMIAGVSDIVIPRTDTPGAGELGVGDFVIVALAHGLEGSRTPLATGDVSALTPFTRPDGSLRHLQWLEHDLGIRGSGHFMTFSPQRRKTLLKALDSEAFGQDRPHHPWRTIKALILTGYYTTEVGGSQELGYEPVPGRWDPDLPINQDDRAFSSDWTALDFG
ncbi:gluconate 2-dehydrogenase subunit 3 family protein [Novosphingobium mathurense]|uniref:Gluconate 2-dehydrogenase subunit 3 n=1 Tax=Novosphingobium mathurense TaxID=428990 RepID=A0A1U6I1W2_9SPHN|nr:gluconate 2-dehydrogenase subunit 3 family protein [Novosphingobium mathurense]SLK02008.1 Gluconate 2-dehydrogenase subunit 3 [Novosphingobium mathurense]